jgi:hypothetical protein
MVRINARADTDIDHQFPIVHVERLLKSVNDRQARRTDALRIPQLKALGRKRRMYPKTFMVVDGTTNGILRCCAQARCGLHRNTV